MALTKVDSTLVDGAINTTSAGNVGIGTSSPADKLEVNGIIRSNTLRTGATNRTLELYSGTAFNTGGAAVAIRGTSTGFNDGGMEFYTGAGAGGSERMRIDSSGNLLVGTTSSPNYSSKLRVQGGIETQGSNQYNIVATSSGSNFEWVLRSGSAMQFFVNNASTVATLTSSGVWTNASDARYKENIIDCNYGLTEVMQLQPRAYNIIGSEKQEIGFIAQEVEALVPELVDSVTNSVTGEDRLTLSYGQLSAVLAKAIQEQQAIINDLKARIETLEAK
jgi:hypothetical protein